MRATSNLMSPSLRPLYHTTLFCVVQGQKARIEIHIALQPTPEPAIYSIQLSGRRGEACCIPQAVRGGVYKKPVIYNMQHQLLSSPKMGWGRNSLYRLYSTYLTYGVYLITQA